MQVFEPANLAFDPSIFFTKDNPQEERVYDKYSQEEVSALLTYKTAGYRALNYILMMGKIPRPLPKWYIRQNKPINMYLKYIRVLDKILIEKKKSKIVYRAMQNTANIFSYLMMNDDVFKNRNFVSTTDNLFTVSAFGGINLFGDKETNIDVLKKKDFSRNQLVLIFNLDNVSFFDFRDIEKTSDIITESEYLVQRNTQFRPFHRFGPNIFFCTLEKLGKRLPLSEKKKEKLIANYTKRMKEDLILHGEYELIVKNFIEVELFKIAIKIIYKLKLTRSVYKYLLSHLSQKRSLKKIFKKLNIPFTNDLYLSYHMHNNFQYADLTKNYILNYINSHGLNKEYLKIFKMLDMTPVEMLSFPNFKKDVSDNFDVISAKTADVFKTKKVKKGAKGKTNSKMKILDEYAPFVEKIYYDSKKVFNPKLKKYKKKELKANKKIANKQKAIAIRKLKEIELKKSEENKIPPSLMKKIKDFLK